MSENNEKKNIINDNTGAAMIIVVCVMAIAITLALSLLASASVMYASSMNTEYDEISHRLALSFSEKLEEQITVKYSNRNSENNAQGAQGTRKGYIWAYLRDNIKISGEWPYYDEDAFGHQLSDEGVVKTFRIDKSLISDENVNNKLGDIKVLAYYSLTEENNINNCELVVKVTSTYGECSNTILSTYSLSINNISDGGTTYEQWVWILNSRE